MGLLELKNIHKSFGGVKAVQNFSLDLEPAQIYGIIGPNGAGKTTIFNLISGIYPLDAGTISMCAQDMTKMPQHKRNLNGLGRTFQNIRLFKGLTVEENVLTAFDPKSRYSFLGGILPLPSRFKEEARGRELSRKYLDYVDLLNLKDERPESLPYGHQRRLEIARALAGEPRVLLLDEPAAGLNPSEVEELKVLIKRLPEELGVAILLIEHHLDVVMELCSKIYVQNFGETIAIGTPEEVQNEPAVIEAYLGKED